MKRFEVMTNTELLEAWNALNAEVYTRTKDQTRSKEVEKAIADLEEMSNEGYLDDWGSAVEEVVERDTQRLRLMTDEEILEEYKAMFDDGDATYTKPEGA